MILSVTLVVLVAAVSHYRGDASANSAEERDERPTNVTPGDIAMDQVDPHPDSPVQSEGSTATIQANDSPDLTSPVLSERIITALFSTRLDEDGFSYQLFDVHWEVAQYTEHTARGDLEALVHIADMNQCHASRSSELWLLKYSQELNNECPAGWRIVRKVTESDLVDFTVIDVDGDGRKEVLVDERICGNGGYDRMKHKILSINDNGADTVLYQSEGYDYRGWMEEGQVLVDYIVEFVDIDHDGKLELLEYEFRLHFEIVMQGSDKHKTEKLQTTVTLNKLLDHRYLPLGPKLYGLQRHGEKCPQWENCTA
ncbi:MAG: hypothetical protein GWP10_17925 [Nitrospiraceae bacterium]|nr:hypothetical protein [Nitrospiraceae bacterium]